MLTKSCVRFFSPSRAALSPILRDEYLTSAIRTKKGEKAGSNQPPACNLVHFKLELTPNYLINYLENTGSQSARYVSMPAPSESSILPKFLEKNDPENARPALISQHDRSKILDQRHLRYACIKLERFLRNIFFQTIPLRAVVISVMFKCSNGLQ